MSIFISVSVSLCFSVSVFLCFSVSVFQCFSVSVFQCFCFFLNFIMNSNFFTVIHCIYYNYNYIIVWTRQVVSVLFLKWQPKSAAFFTCEGDNTRDRPWSWENSSISNLNFCKSFSQMLKFGFWNKTLRLSTWLTYGLYMHIYVLLTCLSQIYSFFIWSLRS